MFQTADHKGNHYQCGEREPQREEEENRVAGYGIVNQQKAVAPDCGNKG